EISGSCEARRAALQGFILHDANHRPELYGNVRPDCCFLNPPADQWSFDVMTHCSNAIDREWMRRGCKQILLPSMSVRKLAAVGVAIDLRLKEQNCAKRRRLRPRQDIQRETVCFGLVGAGLHLGDHVIALMPMKDVSELVDEHKRKRLVSEAERELVD